MNMSMIHLLIGITAIIGTVITYYAALKIHHKYHYPFTLPMLIATIIIVLILLIIPISYETYMIGGEWINKLLGPAVVALAYPLYMERKLLKKMVVPILVGTCIGALVGISTGVLLAKWAGFGEEILLTISSKSVTTPISMAITESLDGITSLAAIFVMIAGVGGAVLHSYVYKYTKIHHYLGKGIGLGSASHGIGTAAALENSQLEGSISSIAMSISAVVVSVITPWMMNLLL